MKCFVSFVLVAGLLAGCGEEVQVPKMIKCDACGKEVSSAGEACANCSHPISKSIDVYKKAQEEVIRRAEEKRKQAEENRRQDEERIRAEEAAAEEERIRMGKAFLVSLGIEPTKEAVKSYGGLEFLGRIYMARKTGATTLRLHDIDKENRITDLTPLKGLTKLEELDLMGNKITDITPLAGLTKLESLGLSNNHITDLTPLAGLTTLEELRLSYNKITDISPLAGLTNLWWLSLSGNQITDDQKAMIKKSLPECNISF